MCLGAFGEHMGVLEYPFLFFLISKKLYIDERMMGSK